MKKWKKVIMKTDDFNKISNKLYQLLNEQSMLVAEVSASSPIIKEWRLEDIQNRVRRARCLQSSQDDFFKNELYHIIGMGNLTVYQTSKLIKSVRELGNDRGVLKQLATIDLKDLFNPSISVLKIGSKAQYISKFFNITLEN